MMARSDSAPWIPPIAFASEGTPDSEKRNNFLVKMKHSNQFWQCHLPYDATQEGILRAAEIGKRVTDGEQEDAFVELACVTATHLRIDQPHSVPSLLFCLEFARENYGRLAQETWLRLFDLITALKSAGYTPQTAENYSAYGI